MPAIRGGTVVAFQDGEHRLLSDGEVAWEGDAITYVGAIRPQSADVVIDARDMLVIPGLISMHMHPGTRANERLYPDRGRRDFFQSGFLNTFAVPKGRSGPNTDIEDPLIGGRYAFLELIRGGVTTAVDVGGGSDGLVEAALETGVRAYAGFRFATASHMLDERGRLAYDWDEARGFAGLQQALAGVEKTAALGVERVRGYLCPFQADTCSPELLRATATEAQRRGLLVQVHTGQNLVEFHELIRRYGRTPIELLAENGILGERTILGHCMMTSAHPFAHLPQGDDLRLMAESGSTVAHSPLPISRRGNALHSFSKYLKAGINVTLGTDTYPRDFISEMRLAGLVSKIVDQTFLSGTARELFDAATLNAARALGRTDLGRLAPGAKADIAVVDLRSLRIGPYRDPIQALVNCAVGDDVDTVVVAGNVLLRERRFLRYDPQEVLASVNAVARAVWDNLPQLHVNMTADEYAPQTFGPYRVDRAAAH